MINKKKSEYAFSFVELIIVVTIISILVAVGYISYNSYISKSRDSSRISQISTIYGGLETAKQIGKIPLPENKVSIYASGSLIGYQGYVGDYVLKQIGYDEEGKDPLDNSNYTYAINSKLRKIQLLTFLENNPTNEDNLGDIKSNLGQEKFERIPKTYGDKLGIILEQNFNPIQNNNLLVTSGIDVETTSSGFIVVFSNSENIYGTGNLLKTLYGTYTTGIVGNNCQDYVYENKGYALKDGDYLINSGSLYKQYCNTSSGVTQYASCIGNLPANSMPTYGNQFLQTYDGEKWIPETLSWGYNNENIGCDFNCEIGFVWDGNSCKGGNGVCGTANGLEFNYQPTGLELCQMGSVSSLSGTISGPWTWTCNGAGTGSTSQSCYTIANGVCGKASTTLYLPPSTPNVNLLCHRGVVANFQDLGNALSRDCNGINGGTNINCSTLVNYCDFGGTDYFGGCIIAPGNVAIYPEPPVVPPEPPIIPPTPQENYCDFDTEDKFDDCLFY